MDKGSPNKSSKANALATNDNCSSSNEDHDIRPSTMEIFRSTFFNKTENFELLRILQNKYSKPYLIFLISIYTIAAASENWVVQWFKIDRVNLPILFALTENLLWPIELFRYIQLQKTLAKETPRLLTTKIIASYIALGIIASFTILCRLFALSLLPPVIAVITSASGVIFETAMSKFVMNRLVTYYQYTATYLIICGIVISFYNPNTNAFLGSFNASKKYDLAVGSTLMIVSSLGAATNIAVADM